jgi:hypothetical protein
MLTVNLGVLKVQWTAKVASRRYAHPLSFQTSTLLRYADIYDVSVRQECTQDELEAAVRRSVHGMQIFWTDSVAQ